MLSKENQRQKVDIKTYADQYNALAGRFLEYCLSDGGNVMISPLSILLLLSIAADSTEGKTREEILKALGDETGKNETGRILGGFQRRLTGRNGSFFSANTVCVRSDFEKKIHSDYRDFMLKQYDAAVFSSEHLIRQVNTWVEARTKGMIREVSPEAVQDALLCMLNAVAFEAAWYTPYEDDEVRDRYFRNADGSRSRVNMLFGSEDEYLENDDFIGFTKPYCEESGFSFMALLPKKEGPEALRDAVNRIDFAELYRTGQYAIVHTVMPEFRFEYQQELKPLCLVLGMETLFSDQADFSPVSAELLKMKSVLHKTYIDVNQSGTRAAAVTMGAVMIGSLPPKEIREVCLDRPFVFAIVHSDSGIPVFTGVVNHLEDAKADPDRVKRHLRRNLERNEERLVRYRVMNPPDYYVLDDSNARYIPPDQREGPVSDKDGSVRGYRPGRKG